MQFQQDTTVTIPFKIGGDYRTPAMSLPDMRQFVITRYEDRAGAGYVITHKTSGHGVSATFATVDNAVMVARVMDVFDWSSFPPGDILKGRAREALLSYTDRGIGSLWPKLAQ